MTLLESLVSLVILAIASVGFLGTFQQSSRAVHDAEQWLRASQVAEATVEARKSGALELPNAAGFVATVSERFLSPGLVDIEVAVQLPEGQQFVVHRIVRR